MSEAATASKRRVGSGLPVLAAAILAGGLGPGVLGGPGTAVALPFITGQTLAVAYPVGLEPGVTDSEPSEVGQASWYGPGFHGQLTASGETYDAASLTVAHRTLPLGSVVRIDNLANGRRVVARVNDRGPFVDGRVVDCSYVVARALGFLRSGVARVRVTHLDSIATAADFEPPHQGLRLPWVKSRSSFMTALDEPLIEDDLVAAAPALALGTWAQGPAATSSPARSERVVRQASVLPYPALLHASRHVFAWLSSNRARLAIRFDLRGRLQRIRLRDVVRRFAA